MEPADICLPGIITAVTPQKRKRDRSSIFVNSEFLMGVDNTVLLKNNLHKGVEMTPFLFRKLQREEGYQVIKAYLLKLLSRRDHSRLELFTKACRKDYPADATKQILDELERKGFINDREFAEKYTHDKIHLNNWGPIKIQAHLRQKGIERQTSEQVIKNTFEEIDLDAQFDKLIKSRKQHFLREENPLKRKKKIADYLLRKGYYGADVYQYLDSMVTIFESSEVHSF